MHLDRVDLLGLAVFLAAGCMPSGSGSSGSSGRAVAGSTIAAPTSSTGSLGGAAPVASATPSGPTLPPVAITSVAIDNDSARVSFAAVPGAADYRIYRASAPTFVKYAGLDFKAGTPQTWIEMNGLSPGQPETLVVEAVDALGPVPDCNVPTAQNTHMYPPAPGANHSMCMLGTNAGDTNDGNISINGQGPITNAPKPIARSAPFTVTASGVPCLPSGSDATQVLFDDFVAGPIVAQGTPDPVKGTMQFLMTTLANNTWDVSYVGADTQNSAPFIMNRHYMDVLFDAGTRGSGTPLHSGHSAMAVAPRNVVDFSGGQILHVTMEVDSKLDNRRWLAFALAPDTDPLTDFYTAESSRPPSNANATTSTLTSPLNATNTAVLAQIFGATIQLDVFSGATTASFTHHDARPLTAGQHGRGLDCRSRFDLFLSATTYSVYEDGQLVSSQSVTGGIPFARARVSFVHFLYVSQQELATNIANAPFESYWIQLFPYSDERHWDNMGFEVLPAGTSFAGLGGRIH